MYDNHMHSQISFDSQMSMPDACNKAIKMGFKGITFTEHIDLDWQNIINFEQYDQYLAAARAAFGAQIKIYQGLEIGITPQLQAQNAAIIAKHSWDFIIASLHACQGHDVYSGEYSRGQSQHRAFKSYLQEIYQSLQGFNDFDVLGHLDMILRDKTFPDATLTYAEYPEELDAILQHLIANGKGLEVNVSGYRFGVGAPHPSWDILKRYQALGGQILTCGSDAHNTSVLGEKIAQTYVDLKAMGFDFVCYFVKRQLQKHYL